LHHSRDIIDYFRDIERGHLTRSMPTWGTICQSEG